MRQNGAMAIIATIAHAQRLEDLLVYRLLIRSTGDLLDDRAEQRVARVVVVPALARCELERAVLEGGDHLGGRLGQRDCGPCFGKVGTARDARCVIEQVADRHRIPCRWALGQMRANFVLDMQLPLLLELHNQHRGELLGDRRQPELGLRRIRHAVLTVRQPIALAEQRLASARDADRATEVLQRDSRLYILVHLCGQIHRHHIPSLVWRSYKGCTVEGISSPTGPPLQLM